MRHFGPVSGPFCAILGHFEPYKMHFRPFGPILASFQTHFGAFWACSRPTWRHFWGPLLAPLFGAHFRLIWGHFDPFGACLGHFGAFWACFWPIWGHFWAFWARFRPIWGTFHGIWSYFGVFQTYLGLILMSFGPFWGPFQTCFGAF